MNRILLVLVILLLGAPLRAEDLIMARIQQPYTEAMLYLQDGIRAKGYEVMHVQRVDVGLQSRGFATAEYRVVFFGKPAEVSALTRQHPELMPFLPMKIILYAEGDTALAVTKSPHLLGEYFKTEALQPLLKQWDNDVRSILDNLRSPGD